MAMQALRRGQDLWTDILERLRQAARATEASTRLSPERARHILEERARRLAAAPRRAEAAEMMQVVTFALGQERYAIETRFVREVRHATGLTSLPGVPDYCAGLVSLRGQLLPVFSLAPLLGLTAEAQQYERIVFLGETQAELGLLAESVFAVVPLSSGALLEPADAAPAPARPYLRGVTADGVILLAAGDLLADPRLVIDQKEEHV